MKVKSQMFEKWLQEIEDEITLAADSLLNRADALEDVAEHLPQIEQRIVREAVDVLRDTAQRITNAMTPF